MPCCDACCAMFHPTITADPTADAAEARIPICWTHTRLSRSTAISEAVRESPKCSCNRLPTPSPCCRHFPRHGRQEKSVEYAHAPAWRYLSNGKTAKSQRPRSGRLKAVPLHFLPTARQAHSHSNPAKQNTSATSDSQSYHTKAETAGPTVSAFIFT